MHIKDFPIAPSFRGPELKQIINLPDTLLDNQNYNADFLERNNAIIIIYNHDISIQKEFILLESFWALGTHEPPLCYA